MDRNSCGGAFAKPLALSLSARRAWIEISYSDGVVSGSGESLSARRAWIEMFDMSNAWHRFTVALRKESVDRNACIGFH